MSTNKELQGKETHQKIFEKAVSSMMSGGSHEESIGHDGQVEVGNEYGGTQYS